MEYTWELKDTVEELLSIFEAILPKLRDEPEFPELYYYYCDLRDQYDDIEQALFRREWNSAVYEV